VHVFLRRPSDRIGIVQSSKYRALPMIRKREHEDFGARAMKQVEMALVGPVEDDVPGAHPVPTGIARLVVAPGKDDGCKGLPMTVPREFLRGRMAHPAGRGTTERGV